MALKSSPRSKVQTVKVRRGLAVLRYTSADTRSSPPILRVETGPGVTMLAEPGRANYDLSEIGQCLVVRAEREATLAVQVVPHTTSASMSAGLTLEYLTGIDEAARAAVASAGTTPSRNEGQIKRSPLALTVLGHLSRLGDRKVAAGEWLGGPDRPMPIEGFAIDIEQAPAGLELRYAASHQALSPLAATTSFNTFVGSRGRALPLRRVKLELVGVDRNEYRLRVEALFLGGAIQTFEGQSVEFGAPDKKTPLTGLRIRLEFANPISTGLSERNGSLKNVDMGSDPRVLVFRS